MTWSLALRGWILNNPSSSGCLPEAPAVPARLERARPATIGNLAALLTGRLSRGHRSVPRLARMKADARPATRGQAHARTDPRDQCRLVEHQILGVRDRGRPIALARGSWEVERMP